MGIKDIVNGAKESAKNGADKAQQIIDSGGLQKTIDGAKAANKAYKEVDKLQKDAGEKGFDEAAADRAKDATKKGAKKVAKEGLKKIGEKIASTKLGSALMAAGNSVMTFLATPPWGWVVSAGLIAVVGFFIVENAPDDKEYTVKENSTELVSTKEKAVIIPYACGTDEERGVHFNSDGSVTTDQSNLWLQKISGKLDNARKIIEWGKAHSLSGGHIAALLAIGARESTLDPTLTYSVGGVRGLFQWSDVTVTGSDINGDRMAWLRNQGLDVNSLENQLKLAEYEFGTRNNGKVIETFEKYQSTSEEDMIGQLKGFNYWFEGIRWEEGQTKSDAIIQYYKDVLTVFPELKDLKMGADMPSKFKVKEGDANNKSATVSQTQVEQCGGSTTIAGGDAFAQALIKDAFRYWNAGLIYDQELRTTNMSWNADQSQLASGYLDCSSFVTTVMMDLGIEGAHLGNTDALFDYEGTILQEIKREEVTTGDIFVSGIPGLSGGDKGHTGIFLNKNWIIHCTSGDWGGNGDKGGDIYINPFAENHFGLNGGKFFRFKNRKLPEKKIPDPKDFLDITTQAGLDKAVASGKLKNPNGIKAE